MAMAKAADEAPGTAGSQFFIVTGDDIGLPAEYAVVGKVTAGQDVVDAIGQLGDPATEQPTEPVVVSTVTVAERLMGGIGAVVLAAGEASRYGGPKQALLLPEVLARLEQAPVDEIVVVEGAYPLEAASMRAQTRVVPAPTGRSGRAPRCAAGLRRSAPRSRLPSSCSPTAPTLRRRL